MNMRSWAWWTLAVLVLALIVAVSWLTPWHRPPAPRADQLAALRSLPTAEVSRGREFAAALRPSRYGSMALGLLVACLLGCTPLGARIVTAVAKPWGGAWLAQVLLGGLVLVLVADVLTLPLQAWRQQILVRYGLSTQGWSGWAIDLAKGYAVGAVIGAVVLVGFFGLVRLSPQRWWIWGALGAALLTILLSFVLPVLIEPVFNTFTPMPAGPLRTELIAMADRDRVPVKDVLVADASRRTKAVNAYVSGFGPTRRIVVYDTLLSQAPESEVVSVVAHELGHAKYRDVLASTLVGALGAAIAVIALYLAGGWAPLLRAAGTPSIGDPRALGLILALTAVFGLVAAPAQALLSRQVEARADAHALALTNDPDGFAAMQHRLSSLNLADPDPPRLEYIWFASHPSTVERIAFARAYARGLR